MGDADSVKWDGMDGMGSSAAGQERKLHSVWRDAASGKGQGRTGGLAGQGAADSHIRRVSVGQWNRKCLEKPESIACSLLSLMLAALTALEGRWKVPAAATDTA